MRLRPFVLLALVSACSASGSTAPDDSDTNSTVPSVDAGKAGKPVSPPKTTGDDDDTTEEDPTEDAGNPKDAGTDASKPDASIPDASPPPDAGPCSFSGILAKYDLSSLTGSAAKADPTTQNGGIVATALVRSGVAVESASGALNASDWPTAAALDATKYFSVTLTAPAGCAFKTSTIALAVKSSGTGPAKASLGTSSDAFASQSNVSTAGATVTVPIVVDTAAGATLEIRIYGFSSKGSSGTMRVDSALTISGSLH